MTNPALSSYVLSCPSSSRSGLHLGSNYGEHTGIELRRSAGGSARSNDDVRRHVLSAVLSEPMTEAAPVEVSESKENRNRGPSRGSGRRRYSKNVAKVEESVVGPKLEWLKEEGIDLTSPKTIWRINQIIGRCSSVSEALGVIEEMKAAGLTTANEGTYLALITACRRQRQGDRALSILQAMKQAGVKPGMLTYNTLISCCQQALRLEDAFRIKGEMEEAGIKPDVVTYTSLMALLVKANPYRGRTNPIQRLEKVVDLYKEMLDSQVQPDTITFNTLMYASAQAKLPGKVLGFYRAMISAGVSPNQFTFGILLESAGTGGRLKSALEVFNEMRAAGIAPQTSTYNYLIEACATSPQPDAAKAWELYEEMKMADDITPNAVTFLNLITASSKGGDHAGAMKAYELMQQLGFSEAKSPLIFNKLIHSASMTDGLESAFKIFEKMQGEGYKPDVVTYSTLLAACARADDLQRALTVGEDFEKIGIRPNQAVLHSLIGVFGKANKWQDAINTFRSMNVADEPPTAVSYSILFDACFGKDGVNTVITHKATKGVLEFTPGMKAAINIYKEAVAAGIYKNYTVEDLSRCDVRQNSRAALVVALLAWLEAVQGAPPSADLVVVAWSLRGKDSVTPQKGRLSWKYELARSTLQAVGLQCEQLNTITMQALTVRSDTLKTWLASASVHKMVESFAADSSEASNEVGLS